MAKSQVPPQQPSVMGPRRSMLIKTIITGLLALIVMAGLTILIIWLAIRPRRPVYFIKGGSINNFHLSKDHHLTASYNLVLVSINPNKRMRIDYKKTDITISFQNQVLASGVIDPWHQPPKRRRREFKLDLKSRDLGLSDAVARELELAKSLDEVVLDVELKSKIRAKSGMLKSRYYHMKVSCVHVVAHFSGNSSKEAHGFCNTYL